MKMNGSDRVKLLSRGDDISCRRCFRLRELGWSKSPDLKRRDLQNRIIESRDDMRRMCILLILFILFFLVRGKGWVVNGYFWCKKNASAPVRGFGWVFVVVVSVWDWWREKQKLGERNAKLSKIMFEGGRWGVFVLFSSIMTQRVALESTVQLRKPLFQR